MRSTLVIFLLLTVSIRAADTVTDIQRTLRTRPSDLTIKLWTHTGWKTNDANLVTIRGDGKVVSKFSRQYPLPPDEETGTYTFRFRLPTDDVERIATRFSDPEILKLPATFPGLAVKPGVFPRFMFYTAALWIGTNRVHEFEHPYPSHKQFKQTPVAVGLIQDIEEAIKRLQQKTAEDNRKLLTPARVKTLLADRRENLWLKLDDIHGLWGGRAVRVSDQGFVVWIDVKHEHQSLETSNFGVLDRLATEQLFLLAADSGVFDLERKRKVGVPDEASPQFFLTARIDGHEVSRTIWLFEEEAQEISVFRKLRQALLRVPGQTRVPNLPRSDLK